MGGSSMIDEAGKIMYNVKELQKVLGIGHTLAYKLVSMPSFPKIMINHRYYIPRDKLELWIAKNTGKNLTA